MRLRLGNAVLVIEYLPAAMACLGAVLLGDRYFPAALCALLHELGHIAVIRFFDGDRFETVVSLRAVGADISDPRRSMRPYPRRIAIALAGPAVNLISVPVFAMLCGCYSDFFGKCTVMSGSLAIFNLLPAYGTDGGEALDALLSSCFSEHTVSVIMRILTVVFLLPACLLGCLVLLRSKNNYTLLLSVIYLVYSLFS